MNTNVCLSFNNQYHVELIDSVTGKTTKSGDFHNITLNKIGAAISGIFTENSDAVAAQGRCRIPIKLLVGSGTTEPAPTNTALANKLWEADCELSNFEWLDDYTTRIRATVSFPATSSYVGTVTEVGLMGGYNYYNSNWGSSWHDMTLMTRSLLTDSEGALITFNKTDLDILKVTAVIEMSLACNTEHFNFFRRPALLHRLLTVTLYHENLTFAQQNGYPNLCRFGKSFQDYQVVRQDNSYKSSSIELVASGAFKGRRNSNERTAYGEYALTRIGTDKITSERYYDSIILPHFGYWQLPNEEIFPAYTIKEISIGTGDGSTTQFINPICYFKEGTEKIYKNSTLLTSGIDYTISSRGNAKELPELTYHIQPIKVSCNTLSATKESAFPMLAVGNITCIRDNATFNLEKDAWGFSANSPLYFEYEEPVTMNCFKNTGSLKYCVWEANYYGYYSWVYYDISEGTVFYLDYSVDGEEYIEIGSISSGAAGVFTFNFSDITAKYWRLRVNSSVTREIVNYTNNNTNYIYLFKKEPYITFTEAPAEGDVLTMEVDMDLIMKNSNFVLDVGARIDFSW